MVHYGFGVIRWAETEGDWGEVGTTVPVSSERHLLSELKTGGGAASGMNPQIHISNAGYFCL